MCAQGVPSVDLLTVLMLWLERNDHFSDGNGKEGPANCSTVMGVGTQPVPEPVLECSTLLFSHFLLGPSL